MSSPEDSASGPGSTPLRRPDADAEARRRLRERVFGEVLPESTGDDREVGEPGERGNDAWLRGNVPPHHG